MIVVVIPHQKSNLQYSTSQMLKQLNTQLIFFHSNRYREHLDLESVTYTFTYGVQFAGADDIPRAQGRAAGCGLIVRRHAPLLHRSLEHLRTDRARYARERKSQRIAKRISRLAR